MTKSRRAKNWRQFEKKATAKLRRRQAKKQLEDAPTKGHKGWSW